MSDFPDLIDLMQRGIESKRLLDEKCCSECFNRTPHHVHQAVPCMSMTTNCIQLGTLDIPTFHKTLSNHFGNELLLLLH
eukprot:m.8275 g.8275  ORF g.8275 m.8275 type:complete len:79 (-) comp6064_c0_seq1:91-327(-)